MLASRMSNGLNKLIDAAAQVDVLRKELERNQEEIAEKNVQVEAVSSFIKYLLLSRSRYFLAVYNNSVNLSDTSYRQREEDGGRDSKSESASVEG